MSEQPGLSAHPVPEDRSWSLMRGESARWDRCLHSHACYELLLICSGHCRYHIAGFEATCTAPTAFLFAPGVEHSLYTEGFLPDGQCMVMTALWMRPALVDGISALPEGRALSALLQRSRQGVQFSCWHAQQACQRLDGLHDDAGLPGLGPILDCLRQLMDGPHWQLGIRAPGRGIKPQDLERLAEFDAWLRGHYDEDITLPVAAAACGMGMTALNALLRRHCGCTFLDYLTRLRLDAARRLLEHGASVTEAAFSSGFQSLATFNRRFRAAEGRSPVAWLAERSDDDPAA